MSSATILQSITSPGEKPVRRAPYQHNDGFVILEMMDSSL